MKISRLIQPAFLMMTITVCHFCTTSCSRTVYPESSFPNIENSGERKKLETFIDQGVEKGLDTRSATPDRIIATARKYLGVPHCMGGTTSKCMDCSGLLVAVFRQYNIVLPHNSEEQARYGKIIKNPANLKKGDLVFFIRSYQTKKFITHAGICTGNNHFIHASTSKGVTITSLSDPWWNEKFIFGTRIF
ncbi:MAG: C40 family peptidase [Bacteroidales bacterium]|nr:C40 family peptidase [Bacteroidales bacterium]